MSPKLALLLNAAPIAAMCLCPVVVKHHHKPHHKPAVVAIVPTPKPQIVEAALHPVSSIPECLPLPTFNPDRDIINPTFTNPWIGGVTPVPPTKPTTDAPEPSSLALALPGLLLLRRKK